MIFFTKHRFIKKLTSFIIVTVLLITYGLIANGQVITTIAGNGFGAGSPSDGQYAGNGGPATSASLNGPFGVAVDDSGNVYIGEHYNYVVRKVNNATGIISTIGGTNSYGFSGDGGPATAAQTTYVAGIALDDSGNIYFCDLYNNRIRKITKATGIITTIAGSGPGTYTGDNGPATSATLYNPYGVAVDHSFNVYITDTYNNVIRKIDKATGIITTIAGDGFGAGNPSKDGRYTGDNGPATSASFYNPNGLAFDDSDKYLYIADSYNNVIRKVDMSTGIITTFAGNNFGAPYSGGYAGDNGAATSAELNHPLAVTVNHSGDVYISDEANNVIRRVDHITGIITTIVGTGYGAGSNGNIGGSTGDGGPATSAELWIPEGVTTDKCGNIYIGDFFNQRVRKVTLAPIQVTVNVPSATICSGNNVTLKAYGADSYTWAPNTELSSTTDSVVVANPTSTITYTVTGTSACSVASATSVITVNGAGGPITISPASPKVCNGETVSLSVPAGLSNVVWTPSTGLNTTTGDTVTATVTAETIYTVTATGGCASPGTDTVMLNVANALAFNPASPQVCPGQTTAIMVSGGANFNWSPSGSLNKSSGDTVLASLPSSLDSLVFTVTGLGLTGCPDTGNVTLRLGGGATAGIASAVRDTICSGTPGNLMLTGNSSNTIQWQSSTDSIAFANDKGDTLTEYKTAPLQQTTWYHATVGTGNCSAVSNTLRLYVPPPLTAYFNLTQTGANQLNFNSDSSLGSIRSYHWDFGDGQTSDEKNPQHTFAKDTIYYVCLTLYDGSNCSYTFCRYTNVMAEAVPEVSGAGNLVIYPNPFTDKIYINGNGLNNRIENITLYDVLGRMVINKQNIGETMNSLQLEVSWLAEGVYFLRIKTSQMDYVYKVIKK